MHDISHAGHLKTVDHEIDESLFGVGIAAFCVYQRHAAPELTAQPFSDFGWLVGYYYRTLCAVNINSWIAILVSVLTVSSSNHTSLITS